MSMKRRGLLELLGLAALSPLARAQTMTPLEAAARAEGRIVSVGMPDIWANWGATWVDLKRLYGLAHVDYNMNSAEEIERMAADGARGTVDIGDVGFEYAAVARGRGVSLASKNAWWDRIPDWAKDADGYWALAYTGTIAFMVDTRRARHVPRSWAQLFASPYRVLVGPVGASAQANSAVLAAAIALGGDETHLQPALGAFTALARAGRLLGHNPDLKRMVAGEEVDVYVMWDFQALAMRDKLGPKGRHYEILIPEDGSLTSGYTPIINRHAPHPNAALLARDYIFSDAGQLNIARGHARPIRVDQLALPESVKRGLLPSEQYAKARLVRPAIWAWEAKKLGPVWQREVLQQK